MNIFSVKDFLATTWLRILKFCTKLDSDELYCATKAATYCLSVPLCVHFSFSPMKISVTDFPAPIGARVFKFCVHLQESKVYCVNAHFAFFSNFQFSFCHSYKIHMAFFLSTFSQQLCTWLRILKSGTKLDSDELYCVTKTPTYCISVPLFVHFSFSPMKISVADFSVPIGANVFKFWVHLQVD